MPDLGPHAIFILAAYGVTFAAVAGLALAILADDRKQRRQLADLERRGVRRRSADAGKTAKLARKQAAMTEQTRPASIRRWGPALPLAIFAVLAGLFWYALQSGDPSLLPSPLIGKKVPDFTLPAARRPGL